MRSVLRAVDALAVTATVATAALVSTVVTPAGAAPSGAAGGGRTEGGVTMAFEKHPFLTHEYGLDHPAAAAYVESGGLLAVAERQAGGSVVVLLKPEREAVVGRMTVPRLNTPRTLADDGRGTLAALDGRALFTWPAASRGVAPVRELSVVGQTVEDPAGMTYDEVSKRWLVLDSSRKRIVVLDVRGATVHATDGPSLAGLGATDLQGIAADGSGRLYVADAASSLIYAVTIAGKEVETFEVDNLDTSTLSSMSIGRTADPTDSPASTSLYTTQRGNKSTFGQVSEVSLQPLGATAAPAPLESTGTLARASALSELSPPSPDPAGIVYMSDLQRLLVADSEVDEMAIYAGVNLWQISRDRSTLHDTGTTLKFSKEPTGVGYDPDGKRLFISDDDRARVFQITAGGDKRFGTADDPVTSFSTRAFGNDDAEDVTYDTVSGDLFISQGIGAEVWRLSPGANGRFDGVAPAGDDKVSNFDVGVYGIVDLEGIGYSPTRDSLFLADRTYKKILEVTKSGGLVQSIDVAGIKMKNPASVTLAPATNDATRTSLYVTARGLDNDKYPDENDGMMYEISAPHLAPVGTVANQAPVVSAGPDTTVTQPSSALLQGSVTDDGLPDPPGFTTSAWSMVSGPGTVSFEDASAPRTTASFSADGTYVLRLTATDSALTGAADVTIWVKAQAPANTPPSVFAGDDQTVTLPASASLAGIVSDDGLPDPPAATSVAWSKVDGPGAVTFESPMSTNTLVSFGVAGTYVLRLTASDSMLQSSDDITVVVQPPPVSGNFVKNPGFEIDTTGWKGSSGTSLSRVAVPRSGDWSGRLTNTGTASTRCTLNDSPNWMPTTQPSTYVLSAWVKGDAAGVGSTVRLSANEYVDQTRVGSKEVSVVLTADWQKLEMSYVPASPGSSWLDYNVVRPSTPAGSVCFFADDLYAGTS